MWRRAPGRQVVLRRLRHAGRSRGGRRWRIARSRPGRSAGTGQGANGVAARVGVVLRSGRLHAAVGGGRPRGGPRAALGLLRPRPGDRLALRRRRGEVHRRRRHGGLGRAGGERGRCGAGGAGRARAGRGRRELRGRLRPERAPGAGRRRDRHGRHDRHGRRGPRRRRPGEHRRPHPGRRPTGPLLCRRGHSPGDRGGDRVLGCRRPPAEGQGRAGAAARGAPRRRRSRRCPQVRRARGPLRRARPRASAREGPLPHLGGGVTGSSRLGDRHRRHRQEPARLGVLQVPRRPLERLPVAPRPLPVLRRRRRPLGAGGDGPGPGRHPRGRGLRVSDGEAARLGGGARLGPRRAALGRASPRPSCWSRGPHGEGQGGPFRRLAAVLRADVRGLPGRAVVRGHAVGRRLVA